MSALSQAAASEKALHPVVVALLAFNNSIHRLNHRSEHWAAVILGIEGLVDDPKDALGEDFSSSAGRGRLGMLRAGRLQGVSR